MGVPVGCTKNFASYIIFPTGIRTTYIDLFMIVLARLFWLKSFRSTDFNLARFICYNRGRLFFSCFIYFLDWLGFFSCAVLVFTCVSTFCTIRLVFKILSITAGNLLPYLPPILLHLLKLMHLTLPNINIILNLVYSLLKRMIFRVDNIFVI